MSESRPPAWAHLADMVSIRIQELHTSGLLRGTQPLLRVDNREEAKRAPFQLDVAAGKLHRAGCPAIPEGSSSALYGVWEIGDNDTSIACPRCKPMPKTDDKTEDSEYPTDLLYGAISIADQFGGVLRERGREYRKSPAGNLVGARIESMYRGINERERNILDIILVTLDELASTIRNIDVELNGANGGTPRGNGAGPPGDGGRAEAKTRRKKARGLSGAPPQGETPTGE
jgi:hypothetical protein